MSVIWEVQLHFIKRSKDDDRYILTRCGSTSEQYDTEEAAQAAYVDAVKQLGGKQ